MIKRSVSFAANLLLAVVLLVSWPRARADSPQAPIPPDTAVQALFVAAGGATYACTAGQAGIYRSTDDGASWVPFATGLGTTDVLGMVAQGDDLLAGTWGGGVYRLNAQTSTWSELNAGISPDYRYIRSMASFTGICTYAVDSRHVLYFLSPGASNWILVPLQGLPAATGDNPTQFVFLGASGLPYLGLIGDGVYLFDASTLSWSRQGLPISAQAMEASADGTLYLGASSGVYRWNGQDWALEHDAWDVTAIRFSPSHGALYVGVRSGEVYRRVQRLGNLWEQVNGLSTVGRVWSLAFGKSSPEPLFVGADDGVAVVRPSYPATPTASPTATRTATPTTTPTRAPTYTLTPATPVPGIRLTLRNDPPAHVPLSVGQNITYTIAYANPGNDTAPQVQITCAVPAGTDYVLGSASDGGTHNLLTNQVQWDLGDVPGRASEALSFSVTVNQVHLALVQPLDETTPTVSPTATPSTTPTATPSITPTATATPQPPAQRILNEGARATFGEPPNRHTFQSNAAANYVGDTLRCMRLPLLLRQGPSIPMPPNSVY